MDESFGDIALSGCANDSGNSTHGVAFVLSVQQGLKPAMDKSVLSG
jgi:hypothetical protein